MKKLMLLACVSVFIFTSSCSNIDTKSTHTHSDGSTHADHDTTKPAQEEFSITGAPQQDTTKKDTSAHTHENGEKHSH